MNFFPFFRNGEPDPTSPQLPAATMQFPPPGVLLEGYKGANGTAFAGGGNGKSGSSSQQTTPPQQRSTASLNVNDPIAIHLLVETALGDSQSFEVLSYEELDALKKEDTVLVARIDNTRRKLALETKVRDAAKSLNRLYSKHHARKTSGSGNTLMRRNSGTPKNDTMDRAESELAASTKKCDELSRELYYHEQRSRQIQMRLLRHTAGILQMTYTNASKRNKSEITMPDGRPDSPESLTNFEYRAWDDVIDGDFDQEKELPQKRDFIDGFLDELKVGRTPKGTQFRQPKASAAQREAQLLICSRLEELAAYVRDVLAQANPKNPMATKELPRIQSNTLNPNEIITEQLNFLTQSIDEIKLEQGYLQQMVETSKTSGNSELKKELESSLQENLALQREYDQAEDKTNKLLEQLNGDIFTILLSNSKDANVPDVPTMDEGPTEQVSYARARLGNLKSLIESLDQAVQRSRSDSAADAERSAQYDMVLEGLWQIIIAGEDDARQRKLDQRKELESKRAAGEWIESDDELSPDEDDGLPRQFSLPSFSKKVQLLSSKNACLKEKHIDLRRRLQQLRGESGQPSSRAGPEAKETNGAEVEELQTRLERTNSLYATTKEELQDAEKRVARNLNTIKELEKELASTTAAAKDEAMAEMTKTKSKLEQAEATARRLELDEETLTKAKVDAEDKLKKAENELRQLEGEVVRLNTELTITKADLDAAYGSRQQRADQFAKAAESEAKDKLDAVQSKLDAALAKLGDADEREKERRKELESALAEFEELTRASVEAEKAREELERTIDGLKEKADGLESQLGEERVNKLGGTKAADAGPGSTPQAGSTSALVLKNEFKKMMRDTRAEHQKVLKAEQDERRRLETILRNIRKDQGPIKSGLNKSYTTA